MRSEYRPLYQVAVAVVVAALVVGLAFAGVSDAAVLVGVVVLAGLMVALFVMSRRHEPDTSDEHDEHEVSGRH